MSCCYGRLILNDVLNKGEGVKGGRGDFIRRTLCSHQHIYHGIVGLLHMLHPCFDIA